jgi:hypothetical protein
VEWGKLAECWREREREREGGSVCVKGGGWLNRDRNYRNKKTQSIEVYGLKYYYILLEYRL